VNHSVNNSGILLFDTFFPIVNMCLGPTQLCDGAQLAIFLAIFLGPAFPPSRMQHISYLHSKAPFTRYNLLSNRLSKRLTSGCIVYTNIQPVFKPV